MGTKREMFPENMTTASNRSETVYEFTGFSTEEDSGTRVKGWPSWYENLTYGWDDLSANFAPMPNLQSASSVATGSGVPQENYLSEEIEPAYGKTTMSVCDKGIGSCGNSSSHALGIESFMKGRPTDSPIQPAAKANSLNNLRKAPMDIIGSVYSTADPNTCIFKCGYLACQGETFGRWYDLKRHHDGAHTLHGPAFWCHIAGCQRSAASGGKPFPRKDKLQDHVRTMHTG